MHGKQTHRYIKEITLFPKLKKPYKIISLIGARGGSKSIPNKNIVNLGGYPLIAYSVVASRLSSLIDETYVSTDSSEISSIAQKYGAKVPFLRPSFLANDASTDFDFFEHFIQQLLANGKEQPDFIVHLRPTTPLREISVINKAINSFLEDDEATSLRSMHKSGTSPYKMFKMKNFLATPVFPSQEINSTNNSRQSFETTYDPNGYVDIVKTNNLAKFRCIHGPKIRIWQTDRVPDIDNEFDLKFANSIIKEKKFETLVKSLVNYGNISKRKLQ